MKATEPDTGVIHVLKRSTKAFGRIFATRYFKGAVSAALIVWLVSLIEWDQLVEAINDADMWLLLVVQGVVAGQIILSAAKWQLLLSLKGRQFSLLSLTRIYYVATFFNNFLPTNIGGDAYRVLRSTQEAAEGSKASAGTESPASVSVWNWEESTAAIVMERATGLVVLLVICYVGAAVGVGVGYELALLKWIVTAGSVAAFATLVVVVPLWVKSDGFKKLSKLPLPGSLKRILIACNTYNILDRRFLPVWAISVIFQLAMVGMVWILAHAIQANVGLLPLMAIVPLRSLAMMLPVSINGIGIGEGAYVVLLRPFGVGVEEAFLIGILTRVMVTLVSIVGGIAYAWGRLPRGSASSVGSRPSSRSGE